MDLTEQDFIDYCDNNPDSEIASLCEVIGTKATLELVSTYSGCTLYIPLVNAIVRNKRDNYIRQDYWKGLKVSQLAKKYGVTGRTIYSIIGGNAK